MENYQESKILSGKLHELYFEKWEVPFLFFFQSWVSHEMKELYNAVNSH